jgi:beta-glucanase (GH16 family)
MSRDLRCALLAATCGAAAVVAGAIFSLPIEAADPPQRPLPPPPVERTIPGWKLAWNDEFDGEMIDEAKWGFDVGNGFYNYDAKQWIHGWGNDELQYYTRDPDNAFLKDGTLRIRALKCSHDGFGYTSARLRTRAKDGTNLFSQTYGRFEFRAKLPLGQGIWPALWLLPEGSEYGGWAASGEIDILEAKGQEPKRIQGALHFGGRWPANTHTVGEHFFDSGSIADFHVYALEWNPGEMHWEVDGKVYATMNTWWSTGRADTKGGVSPRSEADLNPWPAPFDKPFQLLINLAVGGRFLGNPDATTPFPAEMEVDYVRVYERTGPQPPLVPRETGTLPFSPTAR